jgi:hypothetical protein
VPIAHMKTLGSQLSILFNHGRIHRWIDLARKLLYRQDKVSFLPTNPLSSSPVSIPGFHPGDPGSFINFSPVEYFYISTVSAL